MTTEAVIHKNSAITAAYERDGFVLLKNVFMGTEVETLRTAVDAVLERARDAQQKPSFLWGGEWLEDEKRQQLDVKGVHDVQFHDAVFGQMLYNARLLDGIEQLIGPNIQLHHTKLIVKPPEAGAPFPMHQDQPYFPHEKHTMLAASVHLDNADEENGCLRVVPGSHKLGPLPIEPDGLYLSPEKYPIDQAVACPAEAGDVLVFNYFTIHGSGLNLSARTRRNILVQMRDPTDNPTIDTHKSRGQGMMLRGNNPNYVPSEL